MDLDQPDIWKRIQHLLYLVDFGVFELENSHFQSIGQVLRLLLGFVDIVDPALFLVPKTAGLAYGPQGFLKGYLIEVYSYIPLDILFRHDIDILL